MFGYLFSAIVGGSGDLASLLAVRPQLKSSSDSSIIIWAGVAAVVVVAAVAAFWLAPRLMGRQGRNSQAGLFAGLCKVHELPRNSRTLLTQLAASYGLAMPSRIFTEPRWLEPNANNSLSRSRAAELAAIRELLFGNGQGGTDDSTD
jgi:hypothetical protein